MSLSPRIENITEIPVSALAYIGDAVYEMQMRLHYLLPPRTAKQYHQLVVSQVRAEQQANLLEKLDLTDFESDLVRRGRNAAGSISRKVDPHIYQKATGFEALIGYLYLADRDRLDQIFTQLLSHIDTPSPP
ncbi:Mini-ribonuclease 3 [Pseudanabaena sp. FACHB-1998]|uniref:Mini-ribonuclease 3 n=1 Tax=Pseudanabaena sp. FACHB-1998 TaxID=2692858 RepID=UPI00168139E7|nr:ribonuclease III domain-containing protein [Pseudanabaena sp. FACHB-1998]MBD2178092.1 Mini-ribonuclease 3 [Pseudanabaena sp. FACHB-1998]